MDRSRGKTLGIRVQNELKFLKAEFSSWSDVTRSCDSHICPHASRIIIQNINFNS
jgi:hypothetical protein